MGGQELLVFPKTLTEKRESDLYRQHQHTAAAAKRVAGKVIICNPIHPLRGQKLEIKQVVRREDGFTELKLRLENGGILEIPASETDFLGPAILEGSKGSLFDAAKLLKLGKKLAGLREKMLDPCFAGGDTLQDSSRQGLETQLNGRQHGIKATTHKTGSGRKTGPDDVETGRQDTVGASGNGEQTT